MPALIQVSSPSITSGSELLLDWDEPPPHDARNKKEHVINRVFTKNIYVY